MYGPNIIQHQFWDHIWTPLIKANLLDPQYESRIKKLFFGLFFSIFKILSVMHEPKKAIVGM